jgi:hypothetical protein
MTADSLNRWLTFSANVGVVIGLILLVAELNQNSQLVRAQIHQARSDNYVSDMMTIADTEFLLPAYKKLSDAGGISDVAALAALDETERERIRRFAQARLADYDNLFYQYSLGYLDDGFYQSRVESSIDRMIAVWEEFGLIEGATPDFVAEIQRIKADQ